jgi:hypothetical protein
MNNILKDIPELFEEARQKSEFDFILTLMNYKSIGSKELMTRMFIKLCQEKKG